MSIIPRFLLNSTKQRGFDLVLDLRSLPSDHDWNFCKIGGLVSNGPYKSDVLAT